MSRLGQYAKCSLPGQDALIHLQVNFYSGSSNNPVPIP